MGAQGTVTVDAGPIGTQTNEASVSVAQSGISAFPTSLAEAWLFPADMSSVNGTHSADEHRAEIENLEVWADTIVAGVGFTVRIRCKNGSLYGPWSVAWAWN